MAIPLTLFLSAALGWLEVGLGVLDEDSLEVELGVLDEDSLDEPELEVDSMVLVLKEYKREIG